MIIHVYTLCYNEEKIMPFFLDHYNKFADKIIVLDNESTDNSRDIALKAGATVRIWQSGNQFNDGLHMQLKQNIYKESRGLADWVMVLDNDEFIYHPNIREVLSDYKDKKINLPKIQGYDMVSETFPILGTPITDQVTLGVRMDHLSKRVVFNPELDMQWTVGCHPQDGSFIKSIKGAKESREADLKLLHYKLLSSDYVKDRYRMYQRRLSMFNLINQFGTHYLQKQEELDRQFNEFYMPNRERVI